MMIGKIGLIIQLVLKFINYINFKMAKLLLNISFRRSKNKKNRQSYHVNMIGRIYGKDEPKKNKTNKSQT